jgi:peptidoglycan/xylan/chitin deacetylase (PgdA/CDA1 family)
MTATHSVFLMYHELELQGRPLCQSDPGYVRYILPYAGFAAQMDWLRDNRFRGMSVTDALRFSDDSTVAITFDDGSETDLLCAAPLLKNMGFGATFYITAGFLGKAGYLSPNQLQELDRAGFEIGCHSMTHPYLPDLSAEELLTEIAGAKNCLEQIVGHSIDQFSCPGGRYDQRTLAAAKVAGFSAVANSRYYTNSSSTDRYQLGRVAIMRGMNLDQFSEICHGRGLWKKRASDSARGAVRKLFGNSAYDRLRGAILEPRSR